MVGWTLTNELRFIERVRYFADGGPPARFKVLQQKWVSVDNQAAWRDVPLDEKGMEFA